MKTGRDFKLCRKGKDIMLRQVADELGVSITYISMFEREKTEMSKSRFEQYKQFLENYHVQ